jgi:hypothetical protein
MRTMRTTRAGSPHRGSVHRRRSPCLTFPRRPFVDHHARLLLGRALLSTINFGERDVGSALGRAPVLDTPLQRPQLSIAVGQLAATEILDQVDVDMLQPYRAARFSA